MNSKFCTIIRDSNKNKLNDLLRTLERQDRIAYGIEDIERLYNIEVDFDQTNKIIQEGSNKQLLIWNWQLIVEKKYGTRN